MTYNQIEYNKLLEQKRANKAGEKLTAARDSESARHNLATEGLQRVSLDETQRSNLVREAETARANRAKEELERQKLSEIARSNVAKEQLQASGLDETIRSNQAREAETYRANVQGEFQRGQEISIKGSTLAETKRANLAKEAETTRANLAKEMETSRHNLATEGETERSNKAREAIDIGRAVSYAADVAARALYYAKDHSTKVNVNPVQSVSPGKTEVNLPNIPTNVEVGSTVKGEDSNAKQGQQKQSSSKKWIDINLGPFSVSGGKEYESNQGTSDGKRFRGSGFSG